jgi:hypothetical protein
MSYILEEWSSHQAAMSINHSQLVLTNWDLQLAKASRTFVQCCHRFMAVVRDNVFGNVVSSIGRVMASQSIEAMDRRRYSRLPSRFP